MSDVDTWEALVETRHELSKALMRIAALEASCAALSAAYGEIRQIANEAAGRDPLDGLP